MGICKYCGKNAGWLRHVHGNCEVQHQKTLEHQSQGGEQLCSIALLAFEERNQQDLQEIFFAVEAIRKEYDMEIEYVQKLLATVLNDAISKFIEDDQLTELEEDLIIAYMKSFGLTLNDAELRGIADRVAVLSILRYLDRGVIPDVDDSHCPINFRPGESYIYSFNGVRFFQEKTRRRYASGSRGLSIRLMKGVTYRLGAYKGEYISESSLEHIDEGSLHLSSKSIYFTGIKNSYRFPIHKIIITVPYANAVGLDMEDGKRDVFHMNDPEILLRLLVKIVRLEVD